MGASVSASPEPDGVTVRSRTQLPHRARVWSLGLHLGGDSLPAPGQNLPCPVSGQPEHLILGLFRQPEPVLCCLGEDLRDPGRGRAQNIAWTLVRLPGRDWATTWALAISGTGCDLAPRGGSKGANLEARVPAWSGRVPGLTGASVSGAAGLSRESDGPGKVLRAPAWPSHRLPGSPERAARRHSLRRAGKARSPVLTRQGCRGLPSRPSLVAVSLAFKF